MRSIPDVPDAPKIDPWAGWDSKTYSIQVVTPILGGGAKAGEPEKGFAVRPSAIRGNLRFWWRTLFAAGRTGRELKDAETAIWGGQKSDGSMATSKVVVEVVGKPMTGRRTSQPRNAFGFGNYPVESYACFPAQELRGENPRPEIPLVREGDAFELNLCIHATEDSQMAKEVKTAFSAWIYLGGVGARTRRGMGSLKCENPPVSLPVVLGGKIKLRWKEASSGLNGWNSALTQYKNFRQCRRPPPVGENTPKRSYWPEPESIRELTNARKNVHQKLVNQGGALDLVGNQPAFPRAALGLPIVTSFGSNPQGDPQQTILVPAMPDHAGSDRMASPVITKAMFVDGKWYAAVIFLRTSVAPELAVQLKSNGGGGNLIGQEMSSARIKLNGAVPSEFGDGISRGDAIVAFSQYLMKQNIGFKSQQEFPA